MIVPALAGNIIDVIVNHTNVSVTQMNVSTIGDAVKNGSSELIYYTIILSVMLIVSSIFTFIRASLFTIAGERVVCRLRDDVFSAILSQEVAFFDKNRTGDLISRLASDCTVLQNTVTVNISMAVRFTFQAIIGFVLLFTISWKMTLGIMALFPFIIIAATVYGKYIKKLSKDVQEALAQASNVSEEAISNIRTVRAFSNEDGEILKYNDKIQHSFNLSIKKAIASGIFIGVTSLITNFAIPGVLWFGGKLTLDGELTTGKLTSFIIYTITVGVAVGGLTSLYGDIMKAVGASDRIFKIQDRVPEVKFSGGDILQEVNGRVTFENVSFAYPTRPNVEVLKNINLTLEPNTTIALVGHSGGGKSTIASLIELFYYPTKGVIKLDDHDIKDLDPKFLRKNIGLVSQEPSLFATTIKENICYGCDENDFDSDLDKEERILLASKQANAYEFISEFTQKFETIVGERGVRLSGGQKQRVAIARALLKNPQILIFDEATSALDSQSEYLVKEALDVLMTKKEGRTVLVIAHRLSTVKNADMVCVIESGEIVETGTHTQLLEQGGLYKQLVSHQLEKN
jgi:ATP-binding cassette subfamily B protein